MFSMDSIDLSPGQYHVLFKYKDLNGEQRLSFKQSLTLPIVEAFYASLPLYFHPNQPLPKHFAGLAY
ncbi:MAG: hypothetical protein GWN16_00385, partial [Calditrichae bacterium]|nr:hypothetical protein [Calditrichia bacterium]